MAQGASGAETQVITIHTDSATTIGRIWGKLVPSFWNTDLHWRPGRKLKEFIENRRRYLAARLWLNKISGGFTVSAGLGGDKQAVATTGYLRCPDGNALGASSDYWRNYSSQGSEDD